MNRATRSTNATVPFRFLDGLVKRSQPDDDDQRKDGDPDAENSEPAADQQADRRGHPNAGRQDAMGELNDATMVGAWLATVVDRSMAPQRSLPAR